MHFSVTMEFFISPRSLVVEAMSCQSMVIQLKKRYFKKNQDALDSKLEKVLVGAEVIKEIHEVMKYISLEISHCKESCNGTENLSDLILENLSTDFESIKKLLNKTVVGREEKTCTDFSKTFLSIVNSLFQINPSQHKDAISNFKKCWKDLPKTMENHTYFVTPKLKQEAAAKYCELHGGKPFIPKSRDELIFYVAMTVEPESEKYSWYPINDIKEEGHLVLQDGTGYNKLEENLIATMKEIRSEIIGLHNNINEVKTSVDTIYFEINTLRSNQNSLGSKLENVISRVKESEEISKDTRNEIGFCRDELRSNQNSLGSKIEDVISRVKHIEEISIDTKNEISKVKEIEQFSKDTRNEKGFCRDELRSYQNSLGLKLENVFSRVKEIEEISNDTRNEISRVKEIEEISRDTRNEIRFCRDELRSNQNSLGSKIENVISRVKHIEEISNDTKNEISRVKEIEEISKDTRNEIGFCRDALRSNQNSLDSKLENAISRIKGIEEISKDTRNEIGFCRENLTDLVLKNKSSQSENQNEIRINEDLSKTMEDHTYFVTPEMIWVEAVSYCKTHGGKPFVPKTQDEFIAYVAQTFAAVSYRWVWYPVNDIEEEGHVVLYDGTDYEKASYKLQKWEKSWPNKANADCASINTVGDGSWSTCNKYLLVLLCQRN